MSHDSTTGKKAHRSRDSILELQKQLNQLQEFLLGSGSFDEKMKAVTKKIVEMMEASFCRIWIIKPGDLCDSGCIHSKESNVPHICRYRDRCLHLVASSGRYTHIDGDHRRVPFGCYKIGRIASEETSKFLSNDVLHDHQIHDHEWARERGLVSFAGYKLQDSDRKPLGVLALFSKHEISSDDDVLLEGISNTTAQVIQNWQAGEALKAERQRLFALLEGLPAYVYLQSPDYTISFANRYFKEHFGDPGGRFCHEVLWGRREACELCPTFKVFDTKEPLIWEWDKSPDGRMYQVYDYPFIDVDGSPLVLEMGIDITEYREAVDALRKEKEFTESALNSQRDTFFVFNPANGRAVRWNKAFNTITGYSDEEIRKLKAPDDYYSPEDIEKSAAAIEKVLEGGKQVIEMDLITKSGRTIPFEYSANAIPGGMKGEQFIVAVGRDITERKQAETKLRENEERLSSFMESATDGFILFDRELNHIEMNRAALDITGMDRNDVIGKNILEIVPDIKESGRYEIYKNVLKTGEPVFISDIVPHPKFGSKRIELKAFKAGDGLGIIFSDVTERKQMEDRLKASLEEKEVLLRELHHRVKNNFQVITSLLRIQGQFIHDEHLLETFRDTENRIRSMSIVHERLYRAGDLSNINTGDFIKNLALEILDSYGMKHRISLETEIEKIALPVETAIPCGIIIAELISNSVKHAFPVNKAGIIRVLFHKTASAAKDGYDCELTVGDNGTGIPGDVDMEHTKSMGLHLVNSMVRRQLDGEIEISSGQGTGFKIRFRIERKKENGYSEGTSG